MLPRSAQNTRPPRSVQPVLLNFSARASLHLIKSAPPLARAPAPDLPAGAAPVTPGGHTSASVEWAAPGAKANVRGLERGRAICREDRPFLRKNLARLTPGEWIRGLTRG